MRFNIVCEFIIQANSFDHFIYCSLTFLHFPSTPGHLFPGCMCHQYLFIGTGNIGNVPYCKNLKNNQPAIFFDLSERPSGYSAY